MEGVTKRGKKSIRKGEQYKQKNKQQENDEEKEKDNRREQFREIDVLYRQME